MARALGPNHDLTRMRTPRAVATLHHRSRPLPGNVSGPPREPPVASSDPQETTKVSSV